MIQLTSRGLLYSSHLYFLFLARNLILMSWFSSYLTLSLSLRYYFYPLGSGRKGSLLRRSALPPIYSTFGSTILLSAKSLFYFTSYLIVYWGDWVGRSIPLYPSLSGKSTLWVWYFVYYLTTDISGLDG